jgi:dipeptidyl aminopeptidase/acylaminoacyl peptidase
MSPEQARGLAVDKRTDIWAFGCVFYEILAGRTAFCGETLSDTIAAILKHEPDWKALRAFTPPEIRDLLRRCLQKDSRRRLRDIGDARIEIDEALSAPIVAPLPEVHRPSHRWSSLAAAVGGALVAVVAFIIIPKIRPRALPAAGLSPARIVATQLTNYGGTEASQALSPDGRSFAFVSDQGGTRDIWLRQVSGGDPVRLTSDAAEEADLAFSPEGERIYFTRSGANGSGIWWIGALGGQAQKMLDNAQTPALSHDGRKLAYVTPDPGGWAIAVIAIDGGAAKTVVRGISTGHGAPRPGLVV